MVPELGNFALILAFCFAIIQGLAPIKGYTKNNPTYSQLSSIALIGQLSFLSFAMLCLMISFVNSDFTVTYVREHSNQVLPFIYRLGAAWGGHEGSLLLWCLILSAWTLAFMIFSAKNIPRTSFTKIIMILGWVSSGFIAFLLLTSNPFVRYFPQTLITGDDLTPVLQDPGLIFHPPMLYLGYVGFAIGFAFAICALLEKKFDKPLIQACKPWIVMPWSCLSVGIALGSWWAYRELGWGGWWFWDPVENASLLPWLAATALIHALIVSEKCDTFKGWAILLAIVTFGLSLIGTFLVRSGVLVSVHAFASDPTRGLFLLAYLTFLIGGTLLLYGWRIKYFYRPPTFGLFSRETLLLINSVVLLTAVATIVLGTLYPIILDALNLQKISVGEPYFNTVFIPIILPLLLLMGLAPHVKWHNESVKRIWYKSRWNIFGSFIISFIIPKLFGLQFHILAITGIFVGIWIILSTSQYAVQQYQSQKHLALSHCAMVIAHLGIAVLVLGVTLNKSYSEERQVKMKPGDITSLANYQFTFMDLVKGNGPNYQSLIATFLVQKNATQAKKLIAEERIYSHKQILSKTGILFNWWRDLYLALGSSLPDGGWSVRIYFKPFVRWIWFGGFMLLVGGLLSVLNSWQKREIST